jgi:hypothetical protein
MISFKKENCVEEEGRGGKRRKNEAEIKQGNPKKAHPM